MTTLPPVTPNFSITPFDLITSSAGGGDVINNGTGNYYNMTMENLPEFYKDAQVTFLVIFLVMIVLGNIVVLSAVALSRNRYSSRMNFFIVNVAVCDLLTGPLIVLPDIISKTVVYWYAGEVVCRLHKFFAMMVTFASNYMLVALSIDRLDAVARPMQFKGSGMKVKVLVATAWALSGLFAIIGLVFSRVEHTHGGPMCNVVLSAAWKWKLYLTLVAIALFFTPAIIICVCYVSIVALIFNRSRILQDMEAERKVVSYKAKNGDSELLRHGRHSSSGASSHANKGIIPQAKIRTIKMTFIIVLVFILCWSPYFIYNLCAVYGAIPPTIKWVKIGIFVQSLVPLNSAANPIIYGVFSTRICKYFGKEFLSARWVRLASLCQRSRTNHDTKTSAADYTSMSDTEDIRISAELRRSSSIPNSGSRVPLIHQKLTEEDRELLSLHVRFSCRDKHEKDQISTRDVKIEVQESRASAAQV